VSYDISIIIPVRNGITGGFEDTLKMVFAQKSKYSYEVLVIDSGSTDGTLEVVRKFPQVRLFQIKPEEFGHGRTRNLGAQNAQGKYLVFLNADAIPVNDHWLEMLVRNFEEDQEVAGVYSRHVPKRGCHFYMRRDIEESMPEHKIIRTKVNLFDFMLFSTVSAAIRREIWQQAPFVDQIDIAEDQDWARRILAKGYKIVYEPESKVFHSHNYSLKELYANKFRVGKALKHYSKGFQGPIGGLVILIGGIVIKSICDFVYILKQQVSFTHKIKEIGIAFAARVVSFIGRYMGSVIK